MYGIDTILNVATNVMNNAWEDDRTERARRENYSYNEKSAQNAFNRQKQLLEQYYTPEAQIKHLQNAGLSPSLMYGGGGTTGTTSAPQGQGSSGLKPDFIPLNLRSMTELKLMEAEAENAKAQAAEHQANADRVNGNNEYGQAEIKQMLADAGLKNAQTDYTNAEKTMQDLENEIKSATTEEQKDEIRWKAKTAEREYQLAVNAVRDSDLEWDFKNETYDARVNEAKERARNLFHDTQLKWTQTQLTAEQIAQVDATIDKIYNEIEIAWKDLALREELGKGNLNFNFYELAKKMDMQFKELKVETTLETEKMLLQFISSMVGSAVIAGGLKAKNAPRETQTSESTTTTRYNKRGQVTGSERRNRNLTTIQ